MKNNQVMIAAVVAVVVVGAAAFFGGMKYQEQRQPAGGNFRQFAANGAGGPGGNRGATTGAARFGGANGGNRPVMGQIISQDDKSITVKMSDGSTKIVLLSESTTINKFNQGAKTDLKTDENVSVFGTTNSDGSVTAQSVQLIPAGMNMGRPGNSASPAATPTATASPTAK